MNRVPISYYDTHTNGDIMSRAINDMDNIASTLQQNLTQFVTSAVTLIGVIVMMLSISWQLTLVALLMIPLSLIVVMIIAPKSQVFLQSNKKFRSLKQPSRRNLWWSYDRQNFQSYSQRPRSF